jgi:hypothetical protein
MSREDAVVTQFNIITDIIAHTKNDGYNTDGHDTTVFKFKSPTGRTFGEIGLQDKGDENRSFVRGSYADSGEVFHYVKVAPAEAQARVLDLAHKANGGYGSYIGMSRETFDADRQDVQPDLIPLLTAAAAAGESAA